MRRETKEVLWEWMPGFAAGIMPLLVFALVTLLVPSRPMPLEHPVLHHLRDGWIGHLLVLAIVTSTVSTFTSYPRLFARRATNAGMGPVTLVVMMLNTMTLAFAVALYTLHESRVPQSYMIYCAVVIAGISIYASLVIEFAIANVKLSGQPPIKPGAQTVSRADVAASSPGGHRIEPIENGE